MDAAEDHAAREAVLQEVRDERRRQVNEEGWSTGHDDDHDEGELALAAACYAIAPVLRDAGPGEFSLFQREAYEARKMLWPWRAEWWKPKSDRRDLIRAAALIVAELERRDRATPAESGLSDLAAQPTTAAPAPDET